MSYLPPFGGSILAEHSINGSIRTESLCCVERIWLNDGTSQRHTRAAAQREQCIDLFPVRFSFSFSLSEFLERPHFGGYFKFAVFSSESRVQLKGIAIDASE